MAEQRRPEGVGAPGVTVTRRSESFNFDATANTIARIGAGIISRSSTEKDELEYAKWENQLDNIWSASRAKGEGPQHRIESRRKLITEGLKKGMKGAHATKLRQSMTPLNLFNYTDASGKEWLVDEKGNKFGLKGQHLQQQPPSEDSSLISAKKKEDRLGVKVQKVAPSSVRAFAQAIGSGMPKDEASQEPYIRDAQELSRLVIRSTSIISDLKGEELYSQNHGTQHAGAMHQINFNTLQGQIRQTMSHLDMIVGMALDDQKASVSKGALKLFSRAFKKDIIDTYMASKGAQLGLGPKFMDSLTTLFDNIDTSTDSYINGAFDGTQLKAELDKMKVKAEFGKAFNDFEDSKIYKAMDPTIRGFGVMQKGYSALASFKEGMVGLGDIPALKNILVQATSKYTEWSIEEDLKKLVDLKGVPNTTMKEDSLVAIVTRLTSDVVYINRMGDMDDIIEAITVIVNDKSNGLSTDNRRRMKKGIGRFKVRVEKASVPMKSWMDKLRDAGRSGATLAEKLFNKVFTD